MKRYIVPITVSAFANIAVQAKNEGDAISKVTKLIENGDIPLSVCHIDKAEVDDSVPPAESSKVADFEDYCL